jgi:hypothetical protein
LTVPTLSFPRPAAGAPGERRVVAPFEGVGTYGLLPLARRLWEREAFHVVGLGWPKQRILWKSVNSKQGERNHGKGCTGSC